jgi:hypothetical protein
MATYNLQLARDPRLSLKETYQQKGQSGQHPQKSRLNELAKYKASVTDMPPLSEQFQQSVPDIITHTRTSTSRSRSRGRRTARLIAPHSPRTQLSFPFRKSLSKKVTMTQHIASHYITLPSPSHSTSTAHLQHIYSITSITSIASDRYCNTYPRFMVGWPGDSSSSSSLKHACYSTEYRVPRMYLVADQKLSLRWSFHRSRRTEYKIHSFMPERRE